MSDTSAIFIVIGADSYGTLRPSMTPHIHHTTADALSEAKRLAAVDRTKRFYIFRSLGYAHVPEPVQYVATPTTVDPDDEVPF